MKKVKWIKDGIWKETTWVKVLALPLSPHSVALDIPLSMWLTVPTPHPYFAYVLPMHFAQMFQGEPESLTPSWIIIAGPTGTKLSPELFFFFPHPHVNVRFFQKKTLLMYIPPTRKILMDPCYPKGKVIHLFTEYFLSVCHMPDTAKQHPHCLKVPAQGKDQCGEWSGVG